MTPVGRECGIYLDVKHDVAPGDVVETRTGRRYGVVSVRVQTRGKWAGIRKHLRVVVLGDEEPKPGATVHRIRWYARKGGSKSAGAKPRGRR